MPGQGKQHSTAPGGSDYDRCMPEHDHCLPAGRRWKRLAGGLIAAEVALTAPAWAETAFATQPNASASARLAFGILIPSIVVIDARTGVVYSNDVRGAPARGATHVVHRDGPPGPGFRPVGRTAMHAARALAGGQVFALP